MKHKFTKTAIIIATIPLIIFVAFVANMFFGNPITKLQARKDIQHYLQATYKDTDYKLEGVHFNAKLQEYYGFIISPSSKDTEFTIDWADGNVTSDSYDYDVAGRYNTLMRYREEVGQQISSLLASIPDVNNEDIYLDFGYEYSKSNAPRSLILDSTYDKSMKLPMELCLYSTNPSPTLDAYASSLEQVHALLQSNGYHIDYYSLSSHSDVDSSAPIHVQNVSPAQIEGGKLLSILKDAVNKEDNSEEEHKLSVISYENDWK